MVSVLQTIIFHWFNIPSNSKKISIQNDISVKMQFAHPFFAAIFSHCVPFPLPGPPEGRAIFYFGPVVSDPRIGSGIRIVLG
jgi:hypothetical protein